MLEALSSVFEPAGRGLTSEQINQQLLLFCASCPDPVAAMNLVLEAPAASTTDDVLEQALAMPLHSVADWPESVLPMSHPLRRMAIDG